MNSWPLKPLRLWRNITGPRESNFIAKLTIASNGSSVTSPAPADIKSSARLAANSSLPRGARRSSNRVSSVPALREHALGPTIRSQKHWQWQYMQDLYQGV